MVEPESKDLYCCSSWITRTFVFKWDILCYSKISRWVSSQTFESLCILFSLNSANNFRVGFMFKFTERALIWFCARHVFGSFTGGYAGNPRPMMHHTDMRALVIFTCFFLCVFFYLGMRLRVRACVYEVCRVHHFLCPLFPLRFLWVRVNSRLMSQSSSYSIYTHKGNRASP